MNDSLIKSVRKCFTSITHVYIHISTLSSMWRWMSLLTVLRHKQAKFILGDVFFFYFRMTIIILSKKQNTRMSMNNVKLFRPINTKKNSIVLLYASLNCLDYFTVRKPELSRFFYCTQAWIARGYCLNRRYIHVYFYGF